MMKRILLSLIVALSVATFSFGQTCVAPQGYVIARADGATVIWLPTGATLFEVQSRVGVDSAAWSVSALVQATGGLRDTSLFNVTGLRTCSSYAVRVRAKCSATSFSDWRTLTFRTLGCVEPCRVPANLFAATRDSSASLNWSPISSSPTATSTYVVQWKRAVDSAWHTVNATTNSLALNHLGTCTEYQFRVKTVCSATLSSDYSAPTRFKTLGCAAPCVTPRELRAVASATNKITLKWANTGVRAYDIQIRTANDTVWTTVRTDTAAANSRTYVLNNTRTCTPYYFRIRSVCGTTINSDWSPAVSTVSMGCVPIPACNAPRRLSYTATATGATFTWDSLATSYQIQWLGSRDSGNWHTVSTGITSNRYVLSGLTACSAYAFRVKANCTATTSSVWSEPIRFSTIGCAPVCVRPVGFTVVLRDTVAVLSWAANTSATATYRLTVTSSDGSFTMAPITVTGNTFTLTGLVRCKVYKAVLNSICTGTISDAVTVGFETRGCVAQTCAQIADMNYITNNDSTVIEGTSLGIVVAPAFELQYRRSNDTAWSSSLTSTRARFVLRNLGICSTYVARMRTICSTSPVIAGGQWRTLDFRPGLRCVVLPNDPTTSLVNGATVSEFAVYPNPGQDALQVAYKLDQTTNIDVELMNLQGQIVAKLNGGNQEQGNYVQTLDNLGGLHDGFYMVVVRANGKVLRTQKWEKQ